MPVKLLIVAIFNSGHSASKGAYVQWKGQIILDNYVLPDFENIWLPNSWHSNDIMNQVLIHKSSLKCLSINKSIIYLPFKWSKQIKQC